MKPGKYLDIIPALRGLAALSVCLFHFTKGFSAEDGLAREVFRYGWMGVEVFFVISGFVIPYSLFRSNFCIKKFPIFLYKRLIRIEPAFLVSIVIILILNYLSSLVPMYKGDAFELNIKNIFLHFGYLVRFFGETWLNPVYWTLEIEFHYYLLIGLLIPLLLLRKKIVNILLLTLLLCSSIFFKEVLPLIGYLDIFLLGIVVAMYMNKQFNSISLNWLIAIVSIIIYFNHGILIVVLSVGTAIGIAYFGHYGKNRHLVFLGNISYSLYLVHIPIGGKLINIFKRFELSEIQKSSVVFLALILSIFGAWILYKLVELPSHKLSKKIDL